MGRIFTLVERYLGSKTGTAMKRKRAKRHYSTMWLRPDDGLRLVVATSTIAAVLLGLFIMMPDLRPSDFFRSVKSASTEAAPAPAKKVVVSTDKIRQAREQSYRTSSIIFVTPNSQCEERRFDNASRQLLSIKDVDCDSRLNRLTPEEEKEERTANIRGVLASFRK
jgi:hypothetical protein